MDLEKNEITDNENVTGKNENETGNIQESTNNQQADNYLPKPADKADKKFFWAVWHTIDTTKCVKYFEGIMKLKTTKKEPPKKKC